MKFRSEWLPWLADKSERPIARYFRRASRRRLSFRLAKDTLSFALWGQTIDAAGVVRVCLALVSVSSARQ